jgi:uncharacterized membrane protein YfhO
MKGWLVQVNGRNVTAGRVNGVFLSFFAERGDSKAIVDYRPATWTWSLSLSILGLCCLGGLGAVKRRRKALRLTKTVE